MRLHAARHVERVRAHHPDSHQTLRQSGPSLLGQIRQPLRLEHVPVGGMLGDVARENVGQRLSDDADVAAGAVHRRVELDAAVVASYQQCTGSSAAPVVIASFAGPAGILVGSPKKSTWTPVRLRSRSAIRHTTLLSIEPLAEQRERWLLAAGQRDHLETQAFPVVDEPPVQRLGFEPFGDGGEPAVCLGHPHPGHVPVPAVRQRHHGTAAVGQRRVDVLVDPPPFRRAAGRSRGDPSSATGTPRASSGHRTPATLASGCPARLSARRR